MQRFEPEPALATMTETGTTVLMGVPAMCITLCQAARTPGRSPPLRIAHIGGAAVPIDVARALRGDVRRSTSTRATA